MAAGLGLLALVLAAAPMARAATCYANLHMQAYPSCQEVSATVALHWAVADGEITFGIDADGEWSWFGLGISEGGMMGADIWVAANEGDSWVARDYFAERFTMPAADKQQDVMLKSVTRHAGATLIEMRRPLVTCDAQDRAVADDAAQVVIWAYGMGAFSYHGGENRGEATLLLAPAGGSGASGTASAAAAGLPADVKTIEMRMMPNFSIPAEPTRYQCVHLELPSDAKYHVYKYEPIVTNKAHLHHLVLYACSAKPDGVPLGESYDCFHSGLLSRYCEEFYMAWAPGVGEVWAPAAAALPFGAGDRRYMMLEVHYTNVELAAGQSDASGLRLYYSSTLKQYDMGVFTTGSYEVAVPPGKTWSTEPSRCPGACTKKLLPGPVTVTSVFLHMHQIGVSMRAQHIRNGVELPPLGVRDYYNFNHQGGVDVPPATRTLLPGDDLLTTCTYSGVGRTNVTTWGLASYDEMW